MNVFDRLRLSERQQVVVALEGTVAGMEAIAAEMRLTEIQALDLRAHRAVNDQNALARGGLERRQRVLAARWVRVKGGGGRPIHSAFRSLAAH